MRIISYEDLLATLIWRAVVGNGRRKIRRSTLSCYTDIENLNITTSDKMRPAENSLANTTLTTNQTKNESNHFICSIF